MGATQGHRQRARCINADPRGSPHPWPPLCAQLAPSPAAQAGRASLRALNVTLNVLSNF